jgi:hypothetical protein
MLSQAKNHIDLLQSLVKDFTNAKDKLQAYLDALTNSKPSIKNEFDPIIAALNRKEGDRTLALLNAVPGNDEGLKIAINLVQTYLQVTEFISQILLKAQDISEQLHNKKTIDLSEKDTICQHCQTVKADREQVDKQLIEALKYLAQQKSTPTIDRIGELLENTDKIIEKIKLSTGFLPIVEEFIDYLADAGTVLAENGKDLKENEIVFLIDRWNESINLLQVAPPSSEQERKKSVAKALEVRQLIEEDYDRLAEIIKLQDPLGLRTP